MFENIFSKNVLENAMPLEDIDKDLSVAPHGNWGQRRRDGFCTGICMPCKVTSF